MKNVVPFVVVSLVMLISCSDNDDTYKLTSEQALVRATSASNDNNQIIVATEEILNVTSEVLLDEGIAHTRTANTRSCDPSVDRSYLIDRTHYDTILYIGTMTIDYEDGQSCSNSEHILKGKIIDDFLYVANTEKEIFTSRETITFDKYVKDSIEISGTIIIRSASSKPVTIETEKTTITYADGTTVIWAGLLNIYTNQDATSKTITGTINGLTRRKEYFTTTVTTPIEYNYNCGDARITVPVSGKLSLQVNGETSELHYGNGNCDHNYTIEIRDNSYDYNF